MACLRSKQQADRVVLAAADSIWPAATTESGTKGAYGWNQAIKSDADAYKVFTADDAKAKPLREAGFGTVLSHVRDGIKQGVPAL